MSSAIAEAMTPSDRDASHSSGILELEALAPSDGASTTRILTVRFVSHDHAGRNFRAVARTRSLVLSSVFKERLPLSARAQAGTLVPDLACAADDREAAPGRRINLTT